MLSATDNVQLQKQWESADLQTHLASQLGQPTANCVVHVGRALCHEVRALTIVLLAGQK